MTHHIKLTVKRRGMERIDYPDDLFLLIRTYVKFVSKMYVDLSNRQIDVVTAFLYLDNKYRDIIIDEDLRWETITSTSERERIVGILNIRSSNLNNIMSNLRKKNVLIGNKIIEDFRVYPAKDLSVKLELVFEQEDTHS